MLGEAAHTVTHLLSSPHASTRRHRAAEDIPGEDAATEDEDDEDAPRALLPLVLLAFAAASRSF